jgi:hypothetical protein
LNCQRHRAVYNDSKKLVKGDDSAVWAGAHLILATV